MMNGMQTVATPPALEASAAAVPSLDNAWARAQFPALSLSHGEREVAFFDNPAGTQVPRAVIDGVAHYFARANANTHGAFLTSRRTDEMIARARDLAAAFLGARSGEEVAFGPNMTTLTFAFSRAFERRLGPGDEIIVSDLDHDANITPWVDLAARGVVVRRIPIQRERCTLDLSVLESLLSKKTRLVAVGLASNAVGTINDVARIARIAHAVGALVWVDAVHYAPHGPIDVQALDCDFLVCSAYKFFGPHLGILWGKAERLAEIVPAQVRPAPSTVPERFETGTKNHEGVAGLVETFGYLSELGVRAGARLELGHRAVLHAGMRAVRAYELELAEHLRAGLTGVRGLQLVGLAEREDLAWRVPTFAFTLEGRAPAEVSQRLAEQGIFTWSGNHYAITLMERLGLEQRGGVVRVGAVHYNTRAEVERLVTALAELR